MGDKLAALSENVTADIKDIRHSLKEVDEAAKSTELQLQAIKDAGVSTQDSCAQLTDRFTLMEQVQQTVRSRCKGASSDPKRGACF